MLESREEVSPFRDVHEAVSSLRFYEVSGLLRTRSVERRGPLLGAMKQDHLVLVAGQRDRSRTSRPTQARWTRGFRDSLHGFERGSRAASTPALASLGGCGHQCERATEDEAFVESFPAVID